MQKASQERRQTTAFMTQTGSDFVLELQPTSISVIGCYATPEALDALEANGAQLVRVAEDELLLLADPSERDRVIETATRQLEDQALVFDLSDGHDAWTLRGDERDELLRRLCAIPIPDPPACLQGLFAHVPAKLLLSHESAVVIVSATVSEYVHERIKTASTDLNLHETDVAPFAAKTVERAL